MSQVLNSLIRCDNMDQALGDASPKGVSRINILNTIAWAHRSLFLEDSLNICIPRPNFLTFDLKFYSKVYYLYFISRLIKKAKKYSFTCVTSFLLT